MKLAWVGPTNNQNTYGNLKADYFKYNNKKQQIELY